MKILIVAKTRRGGGACVGGITETGASVRLIASDADRNERAGLEYEVGEVWDVESVPDADPVPPHVENIIVLRARRLRRSHKLAETIHRFMPPVVGSPEKLFGGKALPTRSGGLYIAKRNGLPTQSTMFWVPDQPLRLDFEGKRLRYRYPTTDGGRTLTFVGFQEPREVIPAGTLLRVSLAHWWRPDNRPAEELRCFVQLSGWFDEQVSESKPAAADQQTPPTVGPTDALALEHRARLVLKLRFGFSEYLPVQADVVARVLRRQDALVVMPTGGGKSLCYELPSLLFEGLTVVVSPLVSLMQDQVTQLGRLGISAACLNHMVELREHMAIANRARNGHLKLLYLAPETLLRPEILVLLEQSRLACLAIDEAHCISEWGHDFRPEYRQIQSVRQRFRTAMCLALTATATPRVREDIRRLLAIPVEGEFVASFNRNNLFLAVEPRRDGLAQILEFLEQHRRQAGIIYCGVRKQVDELCADLNANGWPALPYHAGLADNQRRRAQERFSREAAPLMVATVAFGMGINKPDVRFVVHANLPKDLESYYQEIGRAGRDGRRADCLLLYNRGDAMVHHHFIEQGAASERRGREARLHAMLRFAETCSCRRKALLNYFGEELTDPCGYCDNCARPPVEGTTLDVSPAALKFLACVQETGQRFGAAQLIAVLRGSRSERVLSRGHDRLRIFGSGREHSTEEWRALVDQVVRKGLIESEPEYGVLHLTDRGKAVLKDSAISRNESSQR